MNKVLLIVIIILLGVIAYKVYDDQKAEPEMMGNRQEQVTYEGEITYKCADGKTIHAVFSQNAANVRFDYEKNIIILAQSTKSPHEFVSSDTSVILYVEADQAGATRNGTTYGDCVAAQ